MIRRASIEDAIAVMKRWSEQETSVEEIGHHANSIFLFKNSLNRKQILRLSDSLFRSYEDTVAELEFVDHLFKMHVPVAPPTRSAAGDLAVPWQSDGGLFIGSSIQYADGIEVQEGSEYWSDSFFKEWGRNLALIHKAAENYRILTSHPKRWEWDQEFLFKKAEDLIPKEDLRSREEIAEVFLRCHKLPKTLANFGLIHGDHAPQNFRYDYRKNIITTFDFGNCCYHWYIADLAISLSTVRRKSNKERIRDLILSGYTSIKEIPENANELIDLFIRLRIIYFYLSRLYFWSGEKTEEQKRNLAIFQERVHSKVGWE